MYLIHCILDWFCSWLWHWWAVECSGNNLHLCDSFPRCENIKCQWRVVFYFFICWHVQILNILKYFKDHIFRSVVAINYFLITRTKLGTFEGLFICFPSIKTPYDNLFCWSEFTKRFLSLIKHQYNCQRK